MQNRRKRMRRHLLWRERMTNVLHLRNIRCIRTPNFSLKYTQCWISIYFSRICAFVRIKWILLKFLMRIFYRFLLKRSNPFYTYFKTQNSSSFIFFFLFAFISWHCLHSRLYLCHFGHKSSHRVNLSPFQTGVFRWRHYTQI